MCYQGRCARGTETEEHGALDRRCRCDRGSEAAVVTWHGAGSDGYLYR